MEKTQKFYTDKVKVLNTGEDISFDNNVCPVCLYLSRDMDDVQSIVEEGACTECTNNFKFAMKDKWEQGQRPTTKVARKRMNIFIEEVCDETTRSST